jgi:hypothetical protein
MGNERERWLPRFLTADFYAPADDMLTRYIRETTAPADAVFIWGTAPEVYVLSGRRCPTRFIYNLPQRAVFAPARWRAELLADLARDPPVLVAVQRADRLPTSVTGNNLDSASSLGNYPELATWLQREYSPATEVPGFLVYRQKARSGSNSGA